jgi:type II secretory pathway component PulK
MYYGSSVTNSSVPQNPNLGFGTSRDQPPNYLFGLKDVFTAVSTGRININTADANVLQLIPGVDAAIAAAIIQQRSGPDGVDGTDDDTPYQNASGALQSAGLNPANANQAANLLTTRSSTFRVEVTAQIGDESRVFTAIILRNTGTDIRVVGFYWK